MKRGKILVHDWPGYAFPIDLSRELASRGYEIRHAYFAGVQGPKGHVLQRMGDPDCLEIVRRTLPEPYAKYGAFKRWSQDTQYGREIALYIAAERPDIVVSSNTPLDVQKAIIQATAGLRVPFVFWLQDILGIAMKSALRGRFGVAGGLIGDYYALLEARLLRKADHVVCICDDFVAAALERGVPAERCTIVENWAPLSDIVPLPKDNAWSRAHGLADKRVFLYSGTLGLKHDPDYLRHLALAFTNDPGVVVVVISEGLGAEWLARRKSEQTISNLLLLPFQPYEKMSEVLASADVLVGLTEPEASRFSVPSKILSYLAAGRPVLLTVPKENFAARMIEEAQAGVITASRDYKGFVDAARRLAGDPTMCEWHGANGCRWSQEKFDIAKIADRFIEIFDKAATAFSKR